MKSLTDDKCEECIHFLHDTDEEAAEAKTDVERKSDEIKAREDAIFMRSEGSVEVRKALARSDADTVKARNEYYSALLKHERLFNKRRTAERIIELWRSVNSNRRAGVQV